VRSPRPAISSVPCTETSCGLVPQRALGVQRTLEMRTAVTCALVGATLEEAPPPAEVGAPAEAAPGATPPALTASAPLATVSAQPLAAARTAKKSVRMRAPLLARRFPSRASPPDGGVRH